MKEKTEPTPEMADVAFEAMLNRYMKASRAERIRLGLPRRIRRPGRNEPCPCGSKKKFKKCCWAKPPSRHLGVLEAPMEDTSDTNTQ